MIGYDTERTETGALVVAAASDGRSWTDPAAADAWLRGLRPGQTLAVHNASYDLGWRHLAGGSRLAVSLADSLVLSWLEDERPPHRLEALASRRLGRKLDKPITFEGGRVLYDGTPIADADPARVLGYCAADAAATADLAAQYLVELGPQLRRWYWEVEEPHLRACIATAELGLPIDVAGIEPTLALARDRAAQAQVDLEGVAGWSINASSPAQVQAWLYGDRVVRRERRLEGLFRTGRENWRWRPAEYPGLALAGGPSTRAADLEALAHPAAGAVLAVREWSKLVGTYLEPMADRVGADGRLRARFNPVGTLTGRISVSDPNLQTLPARRESGRLVRRLVAAPPGRVLVVADYSQLEPRIMEWLAGDPPSEDAHQALADRLGCSRQTAKTVGLAARYGAGAGKVAATLGVSEREAHGLLRAFWTRNPGLAAWRRGVEDQARQTGLIELPSGRRRHLDEATWEDSPRQSRALRQAVNVWCQGTGADVLRVAVAGLWRRGVVPVLQVHDSIVLEVDAADGPDAAAELEQVMVGAGQRAGVGATLSVDVKIVERWE